MNKIELMVPAGDIKSFILAIDSGADSIYAGFKSLNARIKAKNFSINEFASIIKYAHERKIKVYAALNTLLKNSEINSALKYLEVIRTSGADAVIVQDLGFIYLIKKYFPEIKIHSSTQMNIHNLDGIRFAEKESIKRVILPRELSKEEILYIRNNTDIELEMFCYGALCYSYSGLCCYSSFIGGSSANRGLCTQPCRREYINDNKTSTPFYLNDLSLIKYIPDIINMGLNSLKIEGRLRPGNYVNIVTKAFRMVIDEYYNKGDVKTAVSEAEKMISETFGRPVSSGYFEGKAYMNIAKKKNTLSTGEPIGKILNSAEKSIELLNTLKLNKGDVLRVKEGLEKGVTFNVISINEVTKNRCVIAINKNINLKKNTIVYRIDKYVQIKELKISPFKIDTDRIKKIEIKLKNDIFKIKTKKRGTKPEYYIKFDNPGLMNTKELYFFDKWIYKLNTKNLNNLNFKNNKRLCFALPEIISDEHLTEYKKFITKIINKGFKEFYISNIGEKNLFSGFNVSLSTSQEVYNINNLASKYLRRYKIKESVIPIEASVSEIKEMIKYDNGIEYILTLFCFPQLFISKIFGDNKNGLLLEDDRDNKIKTYFDGEFYRTISKTPYSLLRRQKEITDMGINKFLIDLTGTITTRRELSKIIKFIQEPEKLRRYTIFNYKRGLK